MPATDEGCYRWEIRFEPGDGPPCLDCGRAMTVHSEEPRLTVACWPCLWQKFLAKQEDDASD